MNSAYGANIKAALALRAAQSPQGIAVPVILLLVINIGIIALAILVAPDKKPQVEFNEGGLVTAVTAVSLAIAGGFAALCFFLNNGQATCRLCFDRAVLP